MTQIPGIYIPVEYDLAKLRSDQGKVKQIITESAAGISNAMNTALDNKQINKGLNSLVNNLSTVSRASKGLGADFSKLGVDLGALTRITGVTEAEFKKLQSRMLSTQATAAQERSLQGIAKSANLSTQEIRTLGNQMGVSKASIDKVVTGMDNLGKSTAFSMMKFKDMIITVGLYTVAFQALSGVVSLVKNEFLGGLKAVEDFGMTITKSTALITTFSQKSKDGDLAGAFIEANNYAKQLVPTLEMIDTKTIASGKDLQAMSETFIANRVLLDINNQKQIEGFTATANALAILTQAENKDIQMRQEIRGLMDGQIRQEDKLGMLLKAKIPDIEKQIAKWREQGTVFENLGKLLEGFNATTGLLEDQWATVGSTMETIHTRILRGMFEPVFKDLIQLAKELNQSLMDTEGNLTPLARGLIKMVNESYTAAKEGASGLGDTFSLASIPINLLGAEFKFLKGTIEDFGRTDLEKVKEEIIGIEQELKATQEYGKEWYQIELFATSDEDIANKRAKLAELYAFVRDQENEMSREKGRSGTTGVPKLATSTTKPYESKASDLNAAMQAEVALVKAAEENKLAIVKTYTDQMQQLNQNEYDLGLSSYSSYLDDKNTLTQKSLQAELAAKEVVLAAARDAAAKLAPITDKEGNARPDKDAKAHADALKKVEEAEKDVTLAADKLTQAQVEGSHAAQIAAKALSDEYNQLQVELLEMSGDRIGAAQLMAQYDDEAIAKQHLSTQEQQVADLKRQIAQREITELKRQDLATSKEASLALAEIDGQYYESLELQTQLFDIELQRTDLLPEQIRLIQKQREEIERMKDPMSAFVKGWEDVIEHQKTSSELMYDLAKTTAQDMQQAFSDTFFDVMKGDFDSIGDVWKDLLDQMLDNFLRMIADMIAAWAATELFEFVFGSASGGSGGSGGGGIGGSLATTAATTAVGAVAEKYLGMTVSEYVMSSYIYPALAEASAAITGATSASVAAASATGTGAAGTLTPALMEATAATGTATTATTTGTIVVAESGGTVVVAEGGAVAAEGGAAVAGESSIGAAGTAAATAVGYVAAAAVVAGLAYAAYQSFADESDTKDRLNDTNISAKGIAQLAGVSDTGELTNLTEEASKALSMLYAPLGNISAISVDAASGVTVFANETVNATTGLTESIGYTIGIFDGATQSWTESSTTFEMLMDEMSEMKPTTKDAIAATAQYVAEMNGLPSVADELVIAFTDMQTGVFDLAGAAVEASGTVAGAVAMMNSYADSLYFMGTESDSGSDYEVNRTESTEDQGYSTENEGYSPSGYMTSDDKKKYQYAAYDGAMAGGGDVLPGHWAIAGESGAEIVWGPAHVTSTKDTANILNGGLNSEETASALLIMSRNIARMTEEIQTINNLGVLQRTA